MVLPVFGRRKQKKLHALGCQARQAHGTRRGIPQAQEQEDVRTHRGARLRAGIHQGQPRGGRKPGRVPHGLLGLRRHPHPQAQQAQARGRERELRKHHAGIHQEPYRAEAQTWHDHRGRHPQVREGYVKQADRRRGNGERHRGQNHGGLHQALRDAWKDDLIHETPPSCWRGWTPSRRS